MPILFAYVFQRKIIVNQDVGAGWSLPAHIKAHTTSKPSETYKTFHKANINKLLQNCDFYLRQSYAGQ